MMRSKHPLLRLGCHCGKGKAASRSHERDRYDYYSQPGRNRFDALARRRARFA
jgi:hypothetical protein